MNEMQSENLGSITGVVVFLIVGVAVGILLKELMTTMLSFLIMTMLAYIIVTQMQIKKYGEEYNIKENKKKSK